MQRNVIQKTKAGAGQHYRIDTAVGIDQLMLLMSKRFPRNAFDAIARGSPADIFLRYYYTEAGMIELVRACKYKKLFGRDPQWSGCKYLFVIVRRQQTRGFGKRERRHGICIEVRINSELYNEPMATFGAAAR